jgi:hypothetical protein
MKPIHWVIFAAIVSLTGCDSQTKNDSVTVELTPEQIQAARDAETQAHTEEMRNRKLGLRGGNTLDAQQLIVDREEREHQRQMKTAKDKNNRPEK